MKRALLIAMVLCAACDNLSAPPPTSMPWLHGFSAVASVLSTAAEDDYGSLELRADLAGDARTETVLASYRLGVAVIDPDGRLVARAPAFDAGGSADGTCEIPAAFVTEGHKLAGVLCAIRAFARARRAAPRQARRCRYRRSMGHRTARAMRCGPSARRTFSSIAAHIA